MIFEFGFHGIISFIETSPLANLHYITLLLAN